MMHSVQSLCSIAIFLELFVDMPQIAKCPCIPINWLPRGSTLGFDSLSIWYFSHYLPNNER